MFVRTTISYWVEKNWHNTVTSRRTATHKLTVRIDGNTWEGKRETGSLFLFLHNTAGTCEWPKGTGADKTLRMYHGKLYLVKHGQCWHARLLRYKYNSFTLQLEKKGWKIRSIWSVLISISFPNCVFFFYHGWTASSTTPPGHTDLETPYSVGVLCMRDRLIAQNSAWQHTIFTTERHPSPRRDSKPQCQQASGRRPTPCLRPRGQRDRLSLCVYYWGFFRSFSLVDALRNVFSCNTSAYNIHL